MIAGRLHAQNGTDETERRQGGCSAPPPRRSEASRELLHDPGRAVSGIVEHQSVVIVPWIAHVGKATTTRTAPTARDRGSVGM